LLLDVFQIAVAARSSRRERAIDTTPTPKKSLGVRRQCPFANCDEKSVGMIRAARLEKEDPACARKISRLRRFVTVLLHASKQFVAS
jgi:hypothetical protein